MIPYRVLFNATRLGQRAFPLRRGGVANGGFCVARKLHEAKDPTPWQFVVQTGSCAVMLRTVFSCCLNGLLVKIFVMAGVIYTCFVAEYLYSLLIVMFPGDGNTKVLNWLLSSPYQNPIASELKCYRLQCISYSNTEQAEFRY